MYALCWALVVQSGDGKAKSDWREGRWIAPLQDTTTTLFVSDGIEREYSLIFIAL